MLLLAGRGPNGDQMGERERKSHLAAEAFELSFAAAAAAAAAVVVFVV